MGTAVSAVNLKEVDVGLTFNAGPVNVEFLPWVTKLAAGAPVNYNYTFFVPDYYRTVRLSLLRENTPTLCRLWTRRTESPAAYASASVSDMHQIKLV